MILVPSIRSFLRSSALDVLGFFAKPARGIHILNGHRISRGSPKMEIFYRQLSELKKLCTFIRIEEAVSLIEAHENPDDTLIAFSFDDGFEECATMIAPVLEQHNVNAAFFINPNFVDGDEAYVRNFTENVVKTPGKQPMRWNQIKKLHQSGHIIGSHTMDHYSINTDDVAVQEYQKVASKKIIESKLNTVCEYFAFPFGKLSDANPRAIEVALNHYKYVFSQADYKNYFSYNNSVINRRHFEPDWPASHVKYFVSHPKKY